METAPSTLVPAFLQEALGLVTVPVAVLDGFGALRFRNTAWINLYETGQGMALGRLATGIVQGFLPDAPTTHPLEAVHQQADGTPISVLMSLVLHRVRNIDLRVVTIAGGRLAVPKPRFVDEVAADAGNRAKSNFLAVVSHELRTPLNAIMGFTQLLEAGINPAESREMLQEINRSSTVLLGLIENLITAAAMDRGQLACSREVLDPLRLLQDACDRQRPIAVAKGVALHLTWGVDHEVPLMVWGDSRRYRQMFDHLIANAVKFTQRGEVVVESHTMGDVFRLRITDTGIGMDQAAIDGLGMAFTQASTRVLLRRYGGCGLGLAIVRHLIADQGGVFAIRSRPNQGTTVEIALPLTRAGIAEEFADPA